MDFFENFAGFLFQPKEQTFLNLEEGFDKNDENKARKLTLFTWIYAGTILTFLYVYPEMWYYWSSIQLIGECWPLYVSTLGEPWMFALVYFISYMIVVKLNRNEFGSWGYKMGRRFTRGRSEQVITKKQYQILSAYTILPMFFWGLFGVYRLLFTEKIQITRHTLPFFNWSLENIIFWGFMIFCLLWKWGIQVKIQRAVFKISYGKALITIGMEMITISLLLGLLWIGGTFMIPLFT